jgi:hypothetical protein
MIDIDKYKEDLKNIFSKENFKKAAAYGLGTFDEAKRAEEVGEEVRKKYDDKYDRLEDTVRHGVYEGLLLNEKGEMNPLESLGSTMMNLQKDEDDTSYIGQIKNYFADESMSEESNIDINNNKFSVALRKKMIAEGNTSEEAFIDEVVNIALDLRKGKESPEIDGLKLQLSLGQLDFPTMKWEKKNILGGPTPYLDTINMEGTGRLKESRIPPQKPKEFNKGGDTMEQQMELFEEGGLKDDGMNRDPISGNEVPSGSMAEEVRDDIPAQLSEGEYVVPADVVRFFGVKFFEDLRMQAKMGLEQMERTGRIGGEPMGVAVVETEETLDPEDEEKIRKLMKGFNTGGVSTDEDFKQDAANKTFNPSMYGTVGGTLFSPAEEKLEGLVKYYHPDGREFDVLYVNGKIANEDNLPYTQEPWSRTKPDSTTGGTSSPSVGGRESDDSDRRDTSAGNFGNPNENLADKYSYLEDNESISTNTLAGNHNATTGDNRMALYDSKDNIIKMTKEGYDNLYRGYEALGGDKNFKGGIAQYANLSVMDKISLMPQQIKTLFGGEVSKDVIAGIVRKDKNTTLTPRMKKNPSILSFILDIIDPDQTMFSSEYVAKPFNANAREPLTMAQTIAQGFSNPSEVIDKAGLDKFGKALQDKTSSKFGLNRVDRFLMGIRKNAKGDPVIFSGGRTRPVTGRDLVNLATNLDRVKDANAFSHKVFMETGDSVAADKAYHDKFLDQSEEIAKNQQLAADAIAGRQPTTQSGPNTGSDNEDGNQSGTAGATSDFGASQYQDEFTGVSTPTVSQPTTNYGYTPTTRDPYEASQDMGAFFDKGGLASKAKAKPKRKKNTKGLGTKPKAT